MICTYIYTHPWDRFLGSNSKILLAPTPPMLKPRLEVSSGTASLRTLNPSSSTAHRILRFLRRAARGDHLAARHPTFIPASRRRDFRPRRKPRYPPQRARAGEGQGVLPGPSPRPRPLRALLREVSRAQLSARFAETRPRFGSLLLAHES